MKSFATSTLVLSLALMSCGEDQTNVLTKGFAWVTNVAPPSLAPNVSQYEHTQVFGIRTSTNAWRGTTRYTLKSDAPVPNAGCTFTDWIPGTWTTEGSKLVLTTPSSDSGSLEMHDCPDGSPPKTMPRPPHFTRAETTYRLTDTTLHLDRQFGDGAQLPVDLVRRN